MVQAGAEHYKDSDSAASAATKSDARPTRAGTVDCERSVADTKLADRAPTLRATPRHSIVVVLPENHVVSPARLEQIRRGINQGADVLVACAGQPTNLNVLQRAVGAAQFLLAPAGTSTEELRELAIRQASGDIVRLLSGARAHDCQDTETELSMTS